MGRRKRATADELLARAEANGYKEGEHREEDAVRDRHKHMEKTIRDQDTALDRYVL
jgi:hypothetical protein